MATATLFRSTKRRRRNRQHRPRDPAAALAELQLPSLHVVPPRHHNRRRRVHPLRRRQGRQDPLRRRGGPLGRLRHRGAVRAGDAHDELPQEWQPPGRHRPPHRGPRRLRRLLRRRVRPQDGVGRLRPGLRQPLREPLRHEHDALERRPRALRGARLLLQGSKGWAWRPLPPPPFLADPAYSTPWNDSSAAVEGDTIFVSPSRSQRKSGITTYRFDTVTQEWGKAGDWVLPFRGNGEFVPELGVWVGFSAGEHCELVAVDSLDSPRAEDRLWVGPATPDNWMSYASTLVNLGGGRFGVAMNFRVRDTRYDYGGPVNDVAVFVGVEVVRGRKGDKDVKMVRHMYKSVTNHAIKCVL